MAAGGSKHKINLSVDHNSRNQNNVVTDQSIQPQVQGHSKHISLAGLQYERNTRLTPANKASTSMKDYDEPEMQIVPVMRPGMSHSRNNHTRIPSLPANIKGSIGGVSGPGNAFNQLKTQNLAPSNKRNQNNIGSTPLTIAPNDINFANSFN